MVHPKDQEKTTFTTPWGTFMYAKMPFGLMKKGETFQWAMDITFTDEKDKIMVIYLDDITVFSKSNEEHVAHLLRMFRKCKKFDISLNPKKVILCYKRREDTGEYNLSIRNKDKSK